MNIIYKQRDCQLLLEKLLSEDSSAVFACLSTVDGNDYAHALSRNDIKPERLAAITSSLLSLSETLSKESARGQCFYNVISTEFGCIVTVRVMSKDRLHIFSLCADLSANMAMVLRLAIDTSNKLAKILG